MTYEKLNNEFNKILEKLNAYIVKNNFIMLDTYRNIMQLMNKKLQINIEIMAVKRLIKEKFKLLDEIQKDVYQILEKWYKEKEITEDA